MTWNQSWNSRWLRGELPDVFLTPGGTFLDEFIEAGVCEPVDENTSKP